jgi:hypothetical protein
MLGKKFHLFPNMLTKSCIARRGSMDRVASVLHAIRKGLQPEMIAALIVV